MKSVEEIRKIAELYQEFADMPCRCTDPIRQLQCAANAENAASNAALLRWVLGLEPGVDARMEQFPLDMAQLRMKRAGQQDIKFKTSKVAK